MQRQSDSKKYLINPFEILVFFSSLSIFFGSLYSYLMSEKTFPSHSLLSIQSRPTSEGRKVASASSLFKTLEFQCLNPEDVVTEVKKVRIVGHICSMNKELADPSQLISSKIINSTHLFEATVFAQTDSREFSTDYIPLTPGENTIHIEFLFYNDPPFSADWKIKYIPQNTSELTQDTHNLKKHASASLPESVSQHE